MKVLSHIERASVLWVLFAGLLYTVSTASADGMLVPVRPDMPVRGHWSVAYHHVDILVRDQAASVSIDQKFINNSSNMIEVEYLFPVPPGAAIDAMTLIVDGKEMVAKLLPADEARRIYEDIVRRKKDPALLEYAGFGLYRTRAFPLEPGKPARVQVHYDYIPKKNDRTVELWYPLNTEKFSSRPIREVRIKADIKSAGDLAGVYSPTHDLTVDRVGPGHVIVSYEDENIIPTTDFQVFYNTDSMKVSATLLTYSPGDRPDGYFLALVSPRAGISGGEAIAKDVVIVLDRSGSMGGEKIAQARASATFILRRLNAGDRYNIITYSDTLETFHKELAAAGPRAVEEDVERVEAVTAGGGTNIHAALERAMALFDDPDRPGYVIFLTDGLATVGQTDGKAILDDTVAANRSGARLFAFGVGYDVNVKLLDKLALGNRGRSDYVKPNETIESKISSLYAKIRNPVMTDMEIDFGFEVADRYPRALEDLFEGDQIVVIGRVADASKCRIPEFSSVSRLVVKGKYLGSDRIFEYGTGDLSWSDQSRFAFIERLWAMRRVGWLLDQVQLNGESGEITDELIALSTRYGIITPYTSFLADERLNLADEGEVRDRSLGGLSMLKEARSGEGGQRAAMTRQRLNLATKAPPAPPADSAGRPATVMVGNSSRADYEQDKAEVVTTVRQAQNTASYRRNGTIWVAANATDVDVAKDLDQAKKVQRYSEEYFELTRANTVAENSLMATQAAGEQLLIRLRGTLYLIE